MKTEKIIHRAVLTVSLCVATTLVACGDEDGAQSTIDRMGRAGVNTAVTDPFFRSSVSSEQMAHDEAQDAYNAEGDPDAWIPRFASRFESNLAIYDGLDRNCGNQLLAGPDATDGRYRGFAEVLADDRLFVNANSGTCQQYLAVEANAVGITNNDCGGRTPLEDTIDTTYSLFAAGALSGVTDGVGQDRDGTASLTDFPFLASPN